MRTRLIVRLGGVALAALAGFALVDGAIAQGRPGGPGSGGPKPVGVVEIKEEAVPFTVELPGRAVAYEQADIRPRVEGVVEEIAYQPGRPVKVGDILFRMERDSYEATEAAAEAEASQADSAAQAAQVTLDRYSKLEGFRRHPGDRRHRPGRAAAGAGDAEERAGGAEDRPARARLDRYREPDRRHRRRPGGLGRRAGDREPDRRPHHRHPARPDLRRRRRVRASACSGCANASARAA